MRGSQEGLRDPAGELPVLRGGRERRDAGRLSPVFDFCRAPGTSPIKYINKYINIYIYICIYATPPPQGPTFWLPLQCMSCPSRTGRNDLSTRTRTK